MQLILQAGGRQGACWSQWCFWLGGCSCCFALRKVWHPGTPAGVMRWHLHIFEPTSFMRACNLMCPSCHKSPLQCLCCCPPMICLRAGNNVVQTNVSRLCQSYVPATCNEQCLAATVDAILAARTAGSSSSRTQQLVSTVVPAVVVPVGELQHALKHASQHVLDFSMCYTSATLRTQLCCASHSAPAQRCVTSAHAVDCHAHHHRGRSLTPRPPSCACIAVVLAAAAIAAVFWHRRRKAAHEALLQKQQQAQREKLNAQLEEGSAGGWSPAGPGSGKGPGGRGVQLAPHGPGVPVGLLGRSMDL